MTDKTVMALAGVIALAGLGIGSGIVGCSSSSDTVAATTSDAGGRDSGKNTPPPSGDTEGAVCPTNKVDLSDLPDFKPPRIIPGACSVEDRLVFRSLLQQSSSVVVRELKATMEEQNPECSACIFGKDDDPQWAPIVERPDGNYYANIGSCEAIVSGSDACGAAVATATTCIDRACEDCKQEERPACFLEARAEGGACDQPYVAVQEACGPKFGSYSEACKIGHAILEASVAKQCGGSKPDAGAEPDGG